MAHPKREAMVTDLLERLDRPAEVAWDQRNDRHDTGLRALLAYDPTATHHMVVQDDALPCLDLVAGMERALAHVPADAPVCGYVGRVRPFAKEIARLVEMATDASWLRMPGIFWGPSIVVPTAAIAEIEQWWHRSNVSNYDRRLSTWFTTQGIDCWYPWPSLVDHRGDESLVPGHGTGRHAHRFLGADVSALSVDWSGPIVDVDNAPQLDRIRQRSARLARR